MESIAEKSKKQNGLSGSESLSDSLSKGSSSSSTSSSRSSSDESKVGKDCCSSPAPLGWPILKAQMTKSSPKDAARDVHNSAFNELDSKISGLVFSFDTQNLNFMVKNDPFHLIDYSFFEIKKRRFFSFMLSHFFL